jgi:hypothetical protein
MQKINLIKFHGLIRVESKPLRLRAGEEEMTNPDDDGKDGMHS